MWLGATGVWLGRHASRSTQSTTSGASALNAACFVTSAVSAENPARAAAPKAPLATAAEDEADRRADTEHHRYRRELRRAVAVGIRRAVGLHHAHDALHVPRLRTACQRSALLCASSERAIRIRVARGVLNNLMDSPRGFDASVARGVGRFRGRLRGGPLHHRCGRAGIGNKQQQFEGGAAEVVVIGTGTVTLALLIAVAPSNGGTPARSSYASAPSV
jgi:hypothetical protein